MSKLLYGKSLSEYDNTDDLDELLSKLTDEEIKELNDDLDPDNSLLPPSQRCRDQTTKEPTGPFERDKLIKFLIDKAKSDPDWDEAVPFEKKIRGKVYASDKKASDLPKNELSELGFDVDLDDGVTEALANATDDELIDLAAILGFTGMMNQVQFHASIENRRQDGGGGFSGVARAEKFKLIPDEPPNMTDVEESIQQLTSNDANLKVLNLNNIKTMSAEVVSRLCTSLGENTNLTELHMAATALTSSMVEPFLLPLKLNKTLQVLNLESNFITGDMILKLLNAISGDKSGITDLRLANQRQRLLGVQMETAISELILQNPRLNNLGLDLETAQARIRVRDHLKKTVDKNKRMVRVNKG